MAALDRDDPVPAGALGHRQGDVRRADQRIGRHHPGLRLGAPGRHGHLMASAIDPGDVGRLEGDPDLLGDAAGVRARGARQDRDELLPAVAADEVGLAKAALQESAERPQDVVADQVPVQLVERAEVI